MKIAVIFTGGTIASTNKEGYITPVEKQSERLIEIYKKRSGRQVSFETDCPYFILSENLSGDFIKRLGIVLEEKLSGTCDGVIVVHGTDTLQYSAAAMGYLFGKNSKPVVFVSSNYVLEDDRANGADNFYYAVEFILKNQGGVWISYRNQDGITYIHRAGRVLPHLPYSDEIFSACGQYFGMYQEGKFTVNPSYREAEDAIRPLSCLPLKEYSGVLMAAVYPGMDYSFISGMQEPLSSGRVKAVVFHAYHSGTLRTDTPELKSFLKAMARRGIPVCLTGVLEEGQAVYASMKEMEDSGILLLGNMSPVAAYIKLWLLLANGREVLELSESLGEDIF